MDDEKNISSNNNNKIHKTNGKASVNYMSIGKIKSRLGFCTKQNKCGRFTINLQMSLSPQVVSCCIFSYSCSVSFNLSLSAKVILLTIPIQKLIQANIQQTLILLQFFHFALRTRTYRSYFAHREKIPSTKDEQKQNL